MEYRSLFETDTDTLLSEISSLEQQQQQQQQQPVTTQPQSMYSTGQYNYASGQSAAVSANGQYPGPGPTQPMYGSVQPQPQQQQQQQSHYMNANSYYSSQPQQQMMTPNMKSNWQSNAGPSPGAGVQPPPQQSQQQQQQPPPPPSSNGGMSAQGATTIQNVQINVQNNFNIAKNMQQANLNQFSTASSTTSTTTTNSTGGTPQQPQPWTQYNTGAGGLVPAQYAPNSATTGKPIVNMSNVPQPQQQPTPQQQQQQMYKLNQFGTAKPSPPPPGNVPQQQQQQPQANYMNNYPPGKPQPPPPGMGYPTGQPTPQTVMKLNQPVTAAVPGQPPQQQQQHSAYQQTVNSNTGYSQPLSSLPPHMQQPQQQPQQQQQQQQQQGYVPYNQTTSIRQPAPYQPSPNKSQQQPQPTAYATAGQNVNVNSVNLNQPTSGSNTATQQLSPNRLNPTPAGGGYYQTGAYPQQQQQQQQPQQYQYMNQNQPGQYPGSYATPTNATPYQTTANTATTPNRMNTMYNTNINSGGIVVGSGGYPPPTGQNPAALQPQPQPQTPMGVTNTNVLNNTISPVGGDGGPTTPTKRGRGKAKPKTDTSSPEDAAGEKTKGKGGKRGKNKQQPDMAVEQTPPTPTGAMNAPPAYTATQQQQQQPSAYGQSPSSMNRLPMVNSNPQGNMIYPTSQQPQPQSANMLQRNDYSSLSPQSTNPTSMYKPPPQPQPAYSNHMNMMSYPAPNNNQNQQPNTNANNVQPYPNHSMMQPMQQPSYSNQQPYMNPNNKPPSLQPQPQAQPVPTGNSGQPTPAFLVKKPEDASTMMYGQSAHNNATNTLPMSMSQAQSQPQPPQQQQPNVTVGPSNVMMPQQAQHQPVISSQYMPTTAPMPMSTNVNTLVNTSTYNMSGQIVKVAPSPNLEPSMLNNHQYHPQMQQPPPPQHQQQQQPLTSPSQVSMMGKPNIDPMSAVNYAPASTTSYITTHPTQPSQTPNIVVASQPTVSNTPYMINSYAQQPPHIDPTKLATTQMPLQPQPQLQLQPPQPQPQVMGAITVSTQQSPAMVVPQPLSTPTPMNVQLTSPHEPMNGTALPPVNNDAPDSLNATLGESTTKSPAKKLTKKQLKLLNNSNGEAELGGGGDTTPSPAKKQRKIRPKKSLDANDTGAPLDQEANSKIDETLDDLMRKFSQQADDEEESGAGGDETTTKKTKKGTKKTQRKKKTVSQTDGEKMENENDDEDESGDEEDSDEEEDDDEANKSKENDEDDDDGEEGDEEEDENKPIENGTNSELDTSLTKKSLKKNRKPTGKKRAERKATIKNLVNEQQTDENGAAAGDVDADDGETKKAKRKYTKKKFRFQPQSGDEDGQPNASDSLTLTTVKLLNDTAGDESQSQSNLLGDDSMAATPATGKKGRKPKMSKLSVADESTTSLSALATTTTTITTPIPNITLPQLGPVSSNRGRRKSAHHLVKLMKKTKRKKRKKTSSGEEDADDDDDSDEFELPVTKASAAAAKKDGETTATAVTAEQDQSTTTNQLGDELTGCGASMGEAAAAAAAASNDEATAKLLQASEKRRSTRTTASKRQKYTDEDYKLKDEDLLMPLADQPDEAAPEQAVNGSIVFASHDSLIVDKILGVRLAKRKTKRKKEKVPKQPKTKTEPPADNAVKTEPETTATPAVVKEEKPAEPEQSATKTDETEPVAANAEPEKKETETVAPTVVEPVVEKPTSPAQPTLSSTENAEQTETKPTSEEPTKPADEPMESDKTIPVEAEKPADESMKVDEPAGESSTEPKPEPTTETPTTITTSTEPPAAAVESAPAEESKMEVQESIEDKKESITTETTESEGKPPHEETDKPTGEAAVEEKKPEPVAEEEEEEEEEESEWEDDGGEIEVEEFYVKYKNLSYLHCEWKSRDELFYSDKRIDQKIKRFKLKKQQQQQMYDWNDDGDTANGYNNDYDELFNPDYVVIDRILDEYDVDDVAKPGSKIKYFLIKWKALPYEEASWELESDVKNIKKIERFHRFNTLVPEIHLRTNPRPKPDKWTPMSESRAYKNDNKLREYQLEGINWLTFCWINGRNCILADEMGLGKTVQSITFLQEVANYGVRGPYLILVPLSTIGNWIREFETWTDFNVIVYHGSSQSRQMIQDYEFYFKEEALVAANVSTKTNKNVVKFNALITTYEVLLSDVPLFCQFKWRSVIIDEAHRLKNKNCKLIEGLRYMDVEHKVLLTGTPLQNNVEELFSLLNFLEPSQFHSSQEFMQEFGDLKTDTQVTKLQAVLKPMMLRRLKEDVEKNLAPKEETIVEVELTNTQKKYYRAILEKNFQFLTRGVSSSNVPNLMNTMMELRKCCNHPYLINGAEDNIIAEFADRLKSTPDEPRLSHDKLALKAMVQASGKLVLVDKLLPKLKAGGHKVLIFSQMIRVLDIIEDYLIQMRFTYERLDGRIRGEMRQEAIDRYSKPDSDRFAFLLCTRAGGLGINLTAADTVIIYDSDWNPQNDLQAQARCHRIGQSKSVKIYRLITRNTYEREMFDRASLKLGLDKAILQSMRNEDKFNQSATANNSMQLSKKEIEDLLKKGAYGAIMEDDAAADKFCEEDIDKILQQRSTVIQIEGGEKGSTFSKASFQTSETNDISIDDPEFWQKWAKKADIDIEEKLNPKDERIIYEPRRRTQTRRYGGPDDLLEESEYSSSSSDENDPNKDQNKDPKTRKGKRGKRGRGEDSTFNGDRTNADGTGADADEAESNVWSRDECYKVEKNLLVFGWSRWSRILKSCEFTAKRVKVQTEQDVESLARSIVAFTLKNYNGDESIKQFIIDLIDPSKSNFDDLKNHQGLAAPVARGRKPRKADETVPEAESAAPKPAESEAAKPDDVLEWAKNVGDLLADDNYKKHLVRQANRILLRLRMLFYIKHEIIGDEYAAKLDADDCSLAHDAMDLQLPDVQVDLPAEWWDKSCDVSMLVGVYKHGFEKYYQMRTDAQLCFLSLCGPPDATDDLLEQQRLQDNEANEEEKNVDADGVDEAAPLTETNTEKEKDTANSTTADSTATNAFKKFPTVSELNNRLRRLIASVQKFKKQEQLMSKRNAERQEKRLSKLASNQERAVMRQMEKQSKWSRREEQSFYKAISTYGVDCVDKTAGTYSWEKFKEISQLDKKLDETLTDYYTSFLYMCRRVCHKISDDEPPPANEVPVEIISEERASRCLQRIELLNKIRNDVLKSEHFDDWIMNRCLGSVDLPDWYVPGKHDRDLVKAAARYGITRTEYYYVNDREFTFKNYLYKYMMHIEQLMNEDAQGAADPAAPVNSDPIQYYFQNQAKIQITFKDLINNELIAEQEQAAKKSSKLESQKPAKSPEQKETIDEKVKSPSPPQTPTKSPEKQTEPEKAQSPAKETDQVEPEKESANNEKEQKEAPNADESLVNKSELNDTSLKDLIIDETVMETSAVKVETPSEEAADKDKENKSDDAPSSPVKVKSETTEDVEMEVTDKASSPAKAKSPAKEKNDDDVQKDEEEEKCKLAVKEEDKSDNKQESSSSKDEEDKPVAAEETKIQPTTEEKEQTAASKEAAPVEEKVKVTETVDDKEEEKPIEETIMEFTSNNPVIQSYFSNNTVPMIMWPKDRVIYNRLEQIIQMFENDGEWPQRNMFMFAQQQQVTNGVASAVHGSNSNSNLLPANAAPLLNGAPPTNSLSISNLIGSSSSNLLAEQRKLMMSPMLLGDTSAMDDDDDTASNNNDPDSADFYAKLSSNPNSQKPKRGRPPKLDLPQLASALGVSAASATAIPADPSNKIRHLLNSIGVAGSPSTNSRSRLNPDLPWHKSDPDSVDDVDIDLPSMKSSSKLGADESANKSGFLEPGEIFRPIGNSKSSSTRSSGAKPQQQQTPSIESENNDSTNGLVMKPALNNNNNNNTKRSRKSMPQQSASAASNPPTPQPVSGQSTGNVNQIDLAALASLFLGQGQDPDERITVINIEDGSRLVGSKAPKRIELPIWLMTHPNYLPDESEIINMTLKNPNIANNLAALYQSSLTGGEAAPQPPPPAPTPPSRSSQRRNNMTNNNNNNNSNNSSSSKKQPVESVMSPTHSNELGDDEQELMLPSRPASSSSSITQPSPGRSSSRPDIKSSRPSDKRPVQQLPNGQQAQQPQQSMFDSNSPLVLFNKLTNKRIDRSKIPNWKSLCSFLDKNEHVYIDPCSNELIRSRYGKNIPDIIRSRMLNPKNTKSQQQPEKQSSPAPQQQQQQRKQPPNKPQQQQQQQQQPPAPSTPNAQQQAAAAAANMFNPFSPNSAAQLQGLSELLAASGGNIDFNNPLAGFMAAALAAQSTPGAPPGGFNPFMLPPPLGLPPGAGSSNPLLELLSKMPPGFDMSSLDELTALAALQGAAMAGQASLPPAPPPTIPSPSLPKPNESKSSMAKNNPAPVSKSKDQAPMRTSNDIEMKKKAPPAPQQQQQQQPQSKELRSRDNPTNKPSSMGNKPNSNSIESKLNPPVDVRKPKPGHQQQQPQQKQRPMPEQSTKSAKESKAQTSQNAALNNNSNNNNNNNNIDFAAVAAAMQQLDPNTNMAALAAMMEQEKLMQDMMNLSQLTGFGAGNPFLFGAGSFPPPPPPPPPQSVHMSKSARARSPSPMERERSVSPANSVASNMSQKQHKSSSSSSAAAANQPPLDFNLFMNNFMNYQLAGGGPLAPPPPPPPLGGLPSLNDLSKLPVELLTALTAAASATGAGGFDPSMFSALAQLNSLSNNVSSANEELTASSGASSSSRSKPSSSFSKQQTATSSSSSKLTPGSSSSSSAKGQSTVRRDASSSSLSSAQLSKKPRMDTSDSGSDFYQQGLDLTLKSRPSSSSGSKHGTTGKPRLKSPLNDD